MTKAVTINLDDAQAAELERMARESGLTIEEMAAQLLDFTEPGLPLTEEEKAKIALGKQQVREGKVTPHEDFMRELKERFGP